MEENEFIELVAERDEWKDTAAQYARNAEFYRELLVRCSAHLGREVYISDDGSVQDQPILLKVPELVAALADRCARAEGDCNPDTFDGLDRFEASPKEIGA